MNLGPMEILFVLVILAVLAAIVGVIVFVATRAARRTTPPRQPDLADRARALKAAGRTEQAIHLVRGETGMDEAQAVAFVNSL